MAVMRALVHDLKFHDRHDARRLFGRWLADAGAELLANADLLVPVPLTRTRLLARRFNQSALLAHEVARVAKVKVEPLALQRVRSTRPQVGLSREERRRNVAGAFAVAPGRKAAIAGRQDRPRRRCHHHWSDGGRLRPLPQARRRRQR